MSRMSKTIGKHTFGGMLPHVLNAEAPPVGGAKDQNAGDESGKGGL